MTFSPEDISPQAACRPAQPDRRQLRRLIVTERRSGSDRRRSVCRPPVTLALDGPALRLRDRPALLVELLVLINIFSAIDLLVTIELMRLGAVEINPIMARLFESGPGPAAVAKLGMVLLATLGLWLLRGHRAALTTAVALTAVYGSLITFELVSLIWKTV